MHLRQRYKCSLVAAPPLLRVLPPMLDKLPPRERELVDLLYAHGASTVAQLCERLPGQLSASAVRAMLTRLEAKGAVRREAGAEGFHFLPVLAPAAARQSALLDVVRVFFNGSAASAATALLGMPETLGAAELDELEQLIAAARQREPAAGGNSP